MESLPSLKSIEIPVKTTYYFDNIEIGDHEGEKVETLSFDPWGRRRNATDWSFNNVPSAFLFDRGYTGHEHLDKFNLINMNGRVYDPTLARFLSPDPFIQAPGYSQSYNRYSYCLNNPLKYTDPSGYKTQWYDESGNPFCQTYVHWNGVDVSASPGSSNHWSDGFRSEYGNYMIGNKSTFNNIYGKGAHEIARGLASNAYSLSQWRQGLVSIDKVRQDGGYWIQYSSGTIGKTSQIILVRKDGVDYPNSLSGTGLVNKFIQVGNAQGGWVNFDNSDIALDIGGGIYGGLRTAVTPGDQWLGNNGKYYNKSWGGNQYTGSRSGAFAASYTYKWAGRATVGATAIIGGIQVYNGYQMDGGQFGYNANLAGAGATGGIIGGWAGAKAGAMLGGSIGALFGGVGVVPGAIIGGFVGGIAGSFTGNKVGEIGVNYYYGR